MAVNLSIKAVPKALAERLRRRAQRNHRSLQGELMAIIEQAGEEGPEAVPVTERTALYRRGTRTSEEIAAEHLARHPQPFTQVPPAVDMIREDRDQR